MSYKIIIFTPDGVEHPDFPCDDLGVALVTARKAVQRCYFHDPLVTIWLGPGSLVRVMSNAELERQVEAQVAFPIDPKAPWRLVVQQDQLQVPLDFISQSAATDAVESMFRTGHLRHTIKDQHDYIYLHPCPGMVFMQISGEEFLQRQREMLEEQVRKKQKDGEPKSSLIIPGSREN
jgi:hypothetical protein